MTFPGIDVGIFGRLGLTHCPASLLRQGRNYLDNTHLLGSGGSHRSSVAGLHESNFYAQQTQHQPGWGMSWNLCSSSKLWISTFNLEKQTHFNTNFIPVPLFFLFVSLLNWSLTPYASLVSVDLETKIPRTASEERKRAGLWSQAHVVVLFSFATNELGEWCYVALVFVPPSLPTRNHRYRVNLP